MFDQYNHQLTKFFRTFRDVYEVNNVELKLKLISKRETNGWVYNLPTIDEITTLNVNDVDLV